MSGHQVRDDVKAIRANVQACEGIRKHTASSPVGRQILWITSAMILCVVVPLLLHEATGGVNNPRSPWWALAITLVSGAAYAGVIASPRRQLFALVLWLFTYLFGGLSPYVQYRLDTTLSTTPDVQEALYPATGLLILAACAATLIGSVLGKRKPLPARDLKPTAVSPRRANQLTAAALVVFAYYASQVGFGSFLFNRADFSDIKVAAWPNPATMNLLTGALHMLLLIGFLAQMAVRRQRKAAGLHANLMPALINGVVLAYAVNPMSTARYIMGTVALAALASFGAYATVSRFRVVAVSALLGMLVLFPLADMFRHSSQATLDYKGPVATLAAGDFDAFAQVANTIEYVNAEGITYGWQLLGVLLFWVPRAIWRNKPVDTGIFLAEYKGYDFVNLSAPIWSELFINFGWVGIVLALGLMGYWFRRWDMRTEAHLRSYPVPPVVVSAVAFYLLIFLRGSMLTASAYLLVILLASWFVTRKPSRRPRVPTSADDATTVHSSPWTS